MYSIALLLNFRCPPSTLCLRPACWAILGCHFFNRRWRSGDHHLCFVVSSGLHKHLQNSRRHLKYFVTITDALFASMNQRFDDILQRVQVSKAPPPPPPPDNSSVP